MWLPVTMIAGAPRAAASSASAGVGRTPQSDRVDTRVADCAADAGGGDPRRTRPQVAADQNDLRGVARRAEMGDEGAACSAAQTSSVMSLDKAAQAAGAEFHGQNAPVRTRSL
jgi:hypothetical protein